MQIELLKPHTHAGNRHAAGEILDLDEARAHWLIAQGAAKAYTPTKPTRRDASLATPDGTTHAGGSK